MNAAIAKPISLKIPKIMPPIVIQKTAWLALGEWEGKAGGYAINGAAAGFVRFLSGSFSGVAGLPLFETAQMLRGFGWPVPGAPGPDIS